MELGEQLPPWLHVSSLPRPQSVLFALSPPPSRSLLTCLPSFPRARAPQSPAHSAYQLILVLAIAIAIALVLALTLARARALALSLSPSFPALLPLLSVGPPQS
eukprot:3059274-Pleurochrysis_carterae.AAC.5